MSETSLSNPNQDAQSGDEARQLRELLEFILDRKLKMPALVMLELYRPLVGIGDALILCLQPFLKLFSMQHALLGLLSSRANIDWLIAELDRAS